MGILLISCSWLWMLNIYRPPGAFWLPMILGGLVLLSFPPGSIDLITDYIHRQGGRGSSSRSGDGSAGKLPGGTDSAGRFPWASGLVLIPVVIAVFTLPRQFSAGFIILLVAVLGGIFCGEGRGRFRPVTGCILGGTVLTLQGFAFPLLAVFSAHVHNVPLFGYILYPFVRLFDPSAAISGGRIFLSSVEEIYGFGVSTEKLALIPMAMFFIGVLVSRIFKGDALRSFARVTLAFILYGAVRFLFVFFAVVIRGGETIFWEPRAILLSLVPITLFMAWIVPYRRSTPNAIKEGESVGDRRGVPVGAAVLVTAAVFLLVGSVTFHDPGRIKKGRVLFDERYSDWEWSTKVYDREWYGSRSGYNYYCLFEYIKCFFEADRGHQPFTPEYLARYDVVIIKTPTQPFTNEEIDIIEDYVRGGGGLFLIGDHTNVFGTSTNLNPLASRFGLRFNYDSTYQLSTMALSFYVPPPLVTHPAVLNMPEFFFATSCSMDSPIFGENVIVGYALRGVMLDYSRRSYFPSKDEKEYEFGFLMQMAGVKAGKGRVLGHTDSTVFSNFFMFVPGKPECFLGALDWLNRTNRWNRLNIVFFVLGLIVSILAGKLLRRPGRLQAGGIVLFGVVLGVVLSVHFFNALKKSSYQSPGPVKEMKTIAFDRDPSSNEMPLTSLVRDRGASLHTFYVWTQRLGLVPSLHPTLQDALESSPVVVVVDPDRSLSIDEIDDVVDFCRKGGNLLLIVDPRNRRSGAKDFLGIFRMNVETAVADTTEIINSKGERICDAINAGTLRGGIPLLTLPGGRVVFAYEKLDKGRFFAFADFHIFSQAFMGPTSVTPVLAQREVYELEFQILEVLMGEREPEGIESYRKTEEPDSISSRSFR